MSGTRRDGFRSYSGFGLTLVSPRKSLRLSKGTVGDVFHCVAGVFAPYLVLPGNI